MGLPVATDEVFKALADGTRRAIIQALAERPMAVHEVASLFAISRPAVSRHLRVLDEAGLVKARRAGKENRYELRSEQLGEVMDWLGRFWSGRLQTLKSLAERTT